MEAEGQAKGHAFAEEIDLIQKRYGWTDEEVKALPFLRLIEAIETAADRKAEEDRQAALNALFAGRWIEPKKSWVDELLYSSQRPDYVAPEMSDEEAVERAWKLLKADRKQREEKEKK